MTVRVSCPFCNTGLTLPGTPPEGRVQCPRCGESFPVKPTHEDAPSSNPVEPGPSPSANGTPAAHTVDVSARPPSPWSFGPLAFLAACLAAVVFGSGLYVLLRRDDPGAASLPPDKPAVTVPPSAVPGLAYLPADTFIAFALQPGPLVPYAERTQTDPRQRLVAAGIPDRVFATLDALGLTLDQIDHIAGGLVPTADNALPRAVIVLALRRPPVDETAFRRALGARRITAADGAVRDQVTVGGLPADMVSLDPRTYLFATDGRDLDGAARFSGRGSAHFPAGLRESMGRLSPASVAWAATDAHDWSANPTVKAIAVVMKQPELPRRLAGVRAASAGVALEPDPQLTLALRAASPPMVAKLEGRFTAAFSGKEPVIRTSGEWVSAEVPFDPKFGVTGLVDVLPK